MKHIKHWLATMAVLLCSITASAATTYPDWTSTNKGQAGSTSSKTYTITANAGDVLTFDWVVSSESGYDKLIVTLDGTEVLNKSGENVGTYEKTFTQSGTYTLLVKYTKDSSVNKGEDKATISNINISVSSKYFVDYVYYMQNSADAVTVLGVDEKKQNVVIPDAITIDGENYIVNAIDDKAFVNCTHISSITIPASITYIPNYAFEGCLGLKELTFADGDETLKLGYNLYVCYGEGEGLFYDCPIEKIYLGRNISYSGTRDEEEYEYGYSPFYGKHTLKQLVISENVTSIKGYEFCNCCNLTSVSIPNSVTSIDYFAFGGCSNLSSIIIPQSVISVSGSAFNGTAWYANHPDGVVYVGGTIYDYKGTMPENTSIVVRDGTVNIGSVFSGHSNLESIVLPEGITRIGGEAFSRCVNLTSITIPESVTYIGEAAFEECHSLTSVVIPKNVKTIGERAFCYCYDMESVTLSDGIITIDDFAFYRCNKLTSLIVPKSVTYIGEYAFTGPDLQSIIVEEGNTKYNSGNGCNAIISSGTLIKGCAATIIPSSVTWIGEGAFYSCQGLTSITIPNSVSCIESEAFQDCRNLSSLTIGENVTKIEEWAFSGCTGLTSIICYAATPPSCERYAFNSVDKSIPIYVPKASVESYKYWNDFYNIKELPGSLTLNQYGSGTYCSEYALDFSEMEGLKAYAATGYDSETGIVTLTRVMTAKAGEGLFIKGEPGDYVVPVLESTSFNTLNMLVGTLEQTELNSLSSDGLYANYKYTVVEGEKEPLFHPFADGSTLSAGKAYLQIPVAWLPQGEARAISYRFDEGTTSIDEEQLANDNDLPAEIYDLMGRRVAVPQKGSLYIINNEKVIY